MSRVRGTPFDSGSPHVARRGTPFNGSRWHVASRQTPSHPGRTHLACQKTPSHPGRTHLAWPENAEPPRVGPTLLARKRRVTRVGPTLLARKRRATRVGPALHARKRRAIRVGPTLLARKRRAHPGRTHLCAPENAESPGSDPPLLAKKTPSHPGRRQSVEPLVPGACTGPLGMLVVSGPPDTPVRAPGHLSGPPDSRHEKSVTYRWTGACSVASLIDPERPQLPRHADQAPHRAREHAIRSGRDPARGPVRAASNGSMYRSSPRPVKPTCASRWAFSAACAGPGQDDPVRGVFSDAPADSLRRLLAQTDLVSPR